MKWNSNEIVLMKIITFGAGFLYSQEYLSQRNIFFSTYSAFEFNYAVCI